MADKIIYEFPSSSLVGAPEDFLVSGDYPASPVNITTPHIQSMAFDDTQDRTAITPFFTMPTFSGTLKVSIDFFINDATNDIQWGAFIESIDFSSDTRDMTGAHSFDITNISTENLTTVDLSSSTVKDPLSTLVTLTNDSSAVAGNKCRIAIRRNEGITDDAAETAYVTGIQLIDSV